MTNYLITKVEGGDEVVDPADPGCRFHVTKPNGSMHCTCPDYRNAPKGTCDHIASIIDRFRKPAPADHPTPAEPIANGYRGRRPVGQRPSRASRDQPGDPRARERPGRLASRAPLPTRADQAQGRGPVRGRRLRDPASE